MSSSPIEPENAASTGSVRPGLGHKNSRDGKHPKTTQWTPPPRTKSASLLTQALATTYEVDEDSSVSSTYTQPSIDPLKSQSRKTLVETPPAEAHYHNGMKFGEEIADSMAMVASLSAGNLRASVTLGNTPTSPSMAFDMNEVSAMLAHHRDFLGTTKVRGTSLERTAKEKRVQDLPGGFYSTNPGDTGMIGEPLPPRTPTSPDSISSNPPTDGMRAQYRSWRDVRPGIAAEKTWSIGGQGPDASHGGQVEKSIGEALAGVEPNSRSRKASHSLGLFKEGLPDDKSISRDSSNASRFRDTFTHCRALSSAGSSVLQQDSLSKRARDIVDLNRPDWRSPSNSPFEDERPSPKHGLDEALNPTHGLAPDTGYFDVSHSIETVTEEQIRKMPPNLLADIRKHHNLTPGAAKGSSFSGSIPLPASEKLQNQSALEGTDVKNCPDVEEDLYDGPGLSHVKSTDEGNDSGEEQVFRALFVPHQSSHQAPDRKGYGPDNDEKLATTQPSVEATSQQWLEEHKVPSCDDKNHLEDETLSTPHATAKHSLDQKTVLRPREGQNLTEINNPATAPALDAVVTTKEHITNGHGQYVHDHQLEVTEPLYAIELKPYRHQVGGHTTMWKFSRRAVCKLLNNRENEFYEKIEHYHPQLLSFMPRYIGVLNVTYRKERRKSTRNGDSGAVTANQEVSQISPKDSNEAPATEASLARINGHNSVDVPSSSNRMISQSLDPATQPVPTVTFADNRHIIPSNFLMPRPQYSEVHHRAHSDSDALSMSGLASMGTLQKSDSVATNRPTPAQNPWGKTNVNKQLRNEVFKDAFLAPIPIQPHKKPGSQYRPLPSRVGTTLRSSNSESSLKAAQQSQIATSIPSEDSIRKKAIKTAAGRVHGSSDQIIGQAMVNDVSSTNEARANAAANEDADTEFDGRAGTSAPEPEIAYAEASSTGKRQRRYSSGGLRRKPTEVAEGRGDLKYFEEADEAGYKGDAEDDVFPMDIELSKLNPSHPANAAIETSPKPELDYTEPGTPISASDNIPTDGPTNMDLPRPVNPKEARARPDSRSEYFLLLEDLTWNMKRPCVMDLKMGTRQYGVEANEKKQKSQRSKCAETTSKQLGVRVCGVQVWDVSKHAYVFQDKYSGRHLKAGREFQEALTRFLYNGIDYASVLRHIPTILEELSQLELLVKGLAGYRFYAASLLMVYDGDIEDPSTIDPKDRKERLKGRNIAVRMADFANCVTKEDFHAEERPCPPRHPDQPDNGFLRGLRSLRRYFTMIQRDIRLKTSSIDSTEFKTEQNGLSFDGMDEDDEGNVSY